MSTSSPRPGRFLLLTVFLAGIGTLGVEMIASRLLAPFFGTSQPIWAVIIGMTLVYLAIGYRIGGRLADRTPDARALYRLIVIAGVATAFIPPLSRPILGFSQGALAGLDVGGFLGALVGVILLFAVPVTLLAMVGPFAARLQLAAGAADLADAGARVGAVSSVSTVGSILGTFLTVLVLIPAIGTAATTYLFALLLVATGLIGLRDWRYLLAPLLVVALAGFGELTGGAVKAVGCEGCRLVAEAESSQNYIQVAERETPAYGRQMALMLNEGLAIHSFYNERYATSNDPLDLTTGGGPWDFFAVAPYFVADRTPASVTRLAMLGSAAGTVPAQFLAYYGPNTTVDAVEIDPGIIAVGRQYFAMDDAAVSTRHPNYRVHADDARYWLATHGGSYDVIGMDAYHQPYIPFHLTTVEFFQTVAAHLTPQGVAVVNAGLGPDGDDRLSQALATTMRRVFPHVYVIETPRGGNQILIGTMADGDGLAAFSANYANMREPSLRAVMETVVAGEFDVAKSRYGPFTDDRAPVEQLIDDLIFKTVTK